MKKSFVLHDESVNTYGFRMLTSGANLEEFKKNPVMLLNHDDWSLPIGRWDNIRIENSKIVADPIFDMNDERGRIVADKVERGFVKAASIGAWPPEATSDDPMYRIDGQTAPTVTKWTVREASICTIGANHNALVFYDPKTKEHIDLSDKKSVLKLMDNKTRINQEKIMDELIKMLNLSDGSSENDVLVKVRTIISDNARLKNENKTLSDAIDKRKNEEKQRQKEEAVKLVDAAIKDGRINAEAKEPYVKLFETDFESAKATLGAITKRVSLASELRGKKTRAELSDFEKKSWDELDREGKLVELRDNYPELYIEKFEKRYGVKPNL